MITLAAGIAFGLGTFALSHFAGDVGIGWSITWGILGFGIFQAVVGLMMQKRIKRDMERVQQVVLDGQKRLQAKMQRWQVRPPGSIKAAQKEMFEDTKVFVKAALKETEVLSKYRHFVPFIERQQATAQLQLNWMIKDFKAVDALMPKALFLDPTTNAMKMARMYMQGRPMDEIGKVYRKAVRRLRYNQNVLLAGAWSWMLVQKGDIDGAFKALSEALKSSDDKTLKANHEQLMNNRPGHFSNSGIGDQWYSLYLEEPRMRTQRQHMVYR